MAAGFSFGGLLGGGDDYDLYGDLLTDKQKSALRNREMTEGLLRMSGAFAEAAKPSTLPTGGIGAALGKGAAALAGGEGADKALKALQTVEAVRAAQRKRELQTKFYKAYEDWMAGGGVGPPPVAPVSTAGVPTTGPGGAPPPPQIDPDNAGFTGVPGSVPGGGDFPGVGAMPPAAPPGAKMTGLLPEPDQVPPPPSPFGGPLAMYASYAGGGGTPGMPPFRRAAASPGAAGAAPGGADPRELTAYIRQQAIARGIDPDVAVQVAMSEGLGNPVGDAGKSHGAFQLYTGGGMGNDFRRATGLDPSDPRNEKATIDYALDNVTRAGWTPWKGAAKAGVGPRTGLPGGPDLAKYAGASLRGERPGDIVLPSGGGGPQLEALQALMQLTRPPGSDDADSGAPALTPVAALAHLNYGQTGALGDPSKPGWTKENLTTVPAPGGARFQVHKNAAADFQGFLKELGDMGYKIDPKASGGYNYRKITGGNALSEHAYGTAIDVNWNDNLYSKDGKKVTNLPPEVGEVAARYNLEWGGNWKDPVDTMHFQWRPPGAGGGQDTVIPSGRGVPASALQRAQYNPLAGAAGQSAGGGKIPGLNVTPEQLAALNAMAEMADLGSPFKSLLETYYKSPGYLAGAAGAETRARLGVEKELKPGIEADILRATMDPKLQLKEKEELINRESKKIEQDRDLANKIQLQLFNDGLAMEKMPDGSYKIIPLTDVQKTRTENERLKTEATEGEKIIDVVVNGREMKMPAKTYREIFSGKGAPELDIPPMSSVQLGKPAGLGATPEGYRTITTPDGKIVQEQVPGGPAARAEEMRRAEQSRSGAVVLQTIDDALAQSSNWTTGVGGALFKNFPGHPAYNLSANLDTIEANVQFDQLQRMRQSSPTGGVLGNVSDQEGVLLRSTMGSLKQAQSKEQFEQHLRRLRVQYQDAINGSPEKLAEAVRQGKITPEQRDAALAARDSGGAPATTVKPIIKQLGGRTYFSPDNGKNWFTQ